MRGTRDTIVAVASPPGRGLRAIVRASGPAVRAMARRAFGSVPEARGVSRVRVTLPPSAAGTQRDADAGTIEFPAIACWMQEGASFTGEDSLEVSCVGAPALVERLAHGLISCAAAEGLAARLAQPGEFAWRAHAAGRLSVDAAEGLAARIAATSDAELAAAADAAHGLYGRSASELVGRVSELLARVEAGIDFTDQEDVVSVDAASVASACGEIAASVDALRGAGSGSRAHAVPLVVLAGAPNAGKSSLFNAVLGRTRSVASALAGTTRDAVVARVPLAGGLEIDLADLAGLEPSETARAPREIAEAMQRRAREMLAVADIVVRCTPCGAARVKLETFGVGVGVDRIVEVATMVDRSDAGAAVPSVEVPADAIATSARDGTGIAQLRSALAHRLRNDRAMRRAQLSAILPRHDAAFAAARALLDDARALAAADRDRSTSVRRAPLSQPELVAGLLRAALDSLGSIAGPVHPDDVLGLVFSRFCIGK